MKFNRFLWDLYAQSERGTQALDYFSKLDSEFVEPAVQEYHLGEDTAGSPVYVDIADAVAGAVAEWEIHSRDDAHDCFADLLGSGGIEVTITDVPAARGISYVLGSEEDDWYDYVAAISLGLHTAHPEFFLPYDFRCRFNELEEIHAEFGIPLPPVPGKSDKRGRGVLHGDQRDLAGVSEPLQALTRGDVRASLRFCRRVHDANAN